MNIPLGITAVDDKNQRSRRMNMLRSENVIVEVRGSQFCIVPPLFQHIENLKWKKPKSNPQNKGSLKLNIHPDIFESLLQFFLYEQLPDTEAFSIRKAKTYIDFVSPLDQDAIKPLVDHLEDIVRKESPSSESSSLMKRGLINMRSSFTTRGSRNRSSVSSGIENHGQPTTIDTADLSNEKVNPTSFMTSSADLSNEKVNPTSFMTSSIPSHVGEPTTRQMTATEISVCSIDETSSISKLSLQSSSMSLGMQSSTYEESIPSSSSFSRNNHYGMHRSLQYQQPLTYEYSLQETNELQCLQNSTLHNVAFGAADFATPIGPLNSEVSNSLPKMHTEWSGSTSDTETNTSKRRSPTQIFRRVFVSDNHKRSNPSKRFVEKKLRPLTHAEWCASEYVV